MMLIYFYNRFATWQISQIIYRKSITNIRNLSQFQLSNKASSNINSINNSSKNTTKNSNSYSKDQVLEKNQLGSTIHKKQIPYWEPPEWYFYAGIIERPIPVAATNVTIAYLWRFLVASPANKNYKIDNKSLRGKVLIKFLNSPNWLKISSIFMFVFGLNNVIPENPFLFIVPIFFDILEIFD